MEKKKTTLLKWLGVAAIIALLACFCRVTVIPDEAVRTMVNEKGETVQVEDVSRTDQYCIDNWDSRIVSTVKERSVEMAQLVADATADLNAAGESYGSRANETSAWSFCVRAEAVVLEIENAEKPNKTQLLLDLAPYDGVADCKLFYGRVFSSNIKNAIRDGVGFLHLDDFANQVEFADLTTSLNNKVKSDILQRNDASALAGKKLSFYGCISLTDATFDKLVVIPVQLDVLGG